MQPVNGKQPINLGWELVATGVQPTTVSNASVLEINDYVKLPQALETFSYLNLTVFPAHTITISENRWKRKRGSETG